MTSIPIRPVFRMFFRRNIERPVTGRGSSRFNGPPNSGWRARFHPRYGTLLLPASHESTSPSRISTEIDSPQAGQTRVTKARVLD